MDWNVRFTSDEGEQIVKHPTPEQAIVAACHALDRGVKVQSIGMGDEADFVGSDVIARIYGIWARAKNPLGLGRGFQGRPNEGHRSVYDAGSAFQLNRAAPTSDSRMIPV